MTTMSRLLDFAWILGFWVDLGNALQARLDDGSCPGELPLKPEGSLIRSRIKLYRSLKPIGDKQGDVDGADGELLIDQLRRYPHAGPRFLHPVVVGLLKGEAPAGENLGSGDGVLLVHGGSAWGGIPSVRFDEGATVYRLACGFSHNGGYGSMTLERFTRIAGQLRKEQLFEFDHGLVYDLQQFPKDSRYRNPYFGSDITQGSTPLTWDL